MTPTTAGDAGKSAPQVNFAAKANASFRIRPTVVHVVTNVWPIISVRMMCVSAARTRNYAQPLKFFVLKQEVAST